jgi:hypothetical protein
MITKHHNHNMNVFLDPFKDFFNMFALFIGVAATFFGDFPSYSYGFLRSNVAETLFIDITTDTLTKADLILSMFMRIVVGVGTLLIARHFAKKKNK